MAPEYVISNGQIIAQDGKLRVSPRRHSFSKGSRNSVHLPNHLKASDFSVKITRKVARGEVRIIDLVTDLVTKELILPLPIESGKINVDLTRDILKVAAIDRVHQPGKMFVGFIKGFGLKSGSIASSGAWDTSDIVVVGTNETDMALAVNRIHSLQGGAVVCENGKILAELPLPIFGLISDLSIPELTQKVDQLNKILSALGSPFKDPLLTLITLTCAAIPYLRICEEGLVNLKDGQTVGLVVD
jgi:adenine deaminase